jgi:hypothetical protein
MMKTETMYYVVSKKLAEAMLGSKSAGKAKGGTVYGMFRTAEGAEAYRYGRWGNSAHLVSVVVEQ